ncbi:MAG: hypothetical protein A3E83_08630 [Gammaproteobacteria bacterium RIFCSPHIGHO2_12_FULL_41_20]|nr:MAG: hypothetical protein A3E83_08630 [Gammaproteobacteria bacterium RIFCSPHIGHO2_12_FULL_41_20]
MQKFLSSMLNILRKFLHILPRSPLFSHRDLHCKQTLVFHCIFFCFTQQAFAWHTAPFSEKELTVITQYLLNNITSQQKPFVKTDEERTIHSHPGAVLASPSNKGSGFSQDYQFHWTRDAAITMQQAMHIYLQNLTDNKLHEALNNYIEFEYTAQQQPSNPGERTLGQPKFNIDTTVWEGVWGRPQNDGAALRAFTLCDYYLNIDGKNVESATWLRAHLLPLIINDLDYVMREWQHTTYDLWEEVNDTEHFFTKMVQKKSLSCGSALLAKLHDDKKRMQTYADTATAITRSLEKHWQITLGYITETVNQLTNKGGGLDSSILLGVLYGDHYKNPSISYEQPWSIIDDRVMHTVTILRNTFASEYLLNKAHPEQPPLIGRYPGDRYDGNEFMHGNPWVLTTSAFAEYYYSLAHAYLKLKYINVTPTNLDFFTQLHLALLANTRYDDNNSHFNEIISALITEGDRYLLTVKSYQQCHKKTDCLHFSEQIDAITGNPTSAQDLTWGYVSILRAMQARKETIH